MAVIKEIKNGSGGVIRIHDDYCKNNTPEDNQKIIDNVWDELLYCTEI